MEPTVTNPPDPIVEGVYPDVYSVNFPYEFVHGDMVAGSEWPGRPAGDLDQVPFREPENYVVLYVDGVGEHMFNKANVTKVEPEAEVAERSVETEGGVLHIADLELEQGANYDRFYGDNNNTGTGTNIVLSPELLDALGNPGSIQITIIAEEKISE